MTPFELFEQWCTLVERLACQVRTLEASTQQDALEALMDSRPTTIPEDTARPCLWCGEAGCEAIGTTALVYHHMEEAACPINRAGRATVLRGLAADAGGVRMPPGAAADLPTPGARARPAWTTRPGWCAPRARRTALPGGDTSPHGAWRTRSSLVLGGLVLAVVLSTQWVRLNCSPSVPLGLYRLAAVREPLTRGTLVVLPVPSSVQGFWSSWVPLLKPIAGLPGDQACVLEETLWIQNVSYGPVLTASHGHPVPHVEGCLVVQAGEVFLASSEPRSLDSRYYGPIPVAALTAQATPLLTWR